MMSDGDYIIRVIDYEDTDIRGAAVLDENGFATIFINARHSAEQQRETMIHELKHIIYDDFYNDDDLDTVRRRVAPPPQKKI